MMFNIVLYQPEIPPNTGNIIRLCANTQCRLHLIQPLGFTLDEKRLRRAGLDYHMMASVQTYPNLSDCLKQFDQSRCFALTTKGHTKYTDYAFKKNDVFVFGPESRGLGEVLNQFSPERRLYLPQATAARSLNLSNSVSIMIFEAWRQNDFSVAPVN